MTSDEEKRRKLMMEARRAVRRVTVAFASTEITDWTVLNSFREDFELESSRIADRRGWGPLP